MLWYTRVCPETGEFTLKLSNKSLVIIHTGLSKKSNRKGTKGAK